MSTLGEAIEPKDPGTRALIAKIEAVGQKDEPQARISVNQKPPETSDQMR